MAFDPDAYLAQGATPTAAPPAFDPDAYLKATSGGTPAPRRTGTRADQIPGYGGPVPAATAAPERPESSFFGKLMAPVETAVTLGTGLITAPLVEASKVYGTLTSGQYGTQAGIRAGEETGRKMQQRFQSPVSPESEAQTQAIGNFLSSTGLQGVPLNMLGDIATLAKPAIQQVAPIIKAPLEARQQRIQAERIAKSYANAPMREATEAAQRIGGVVPPSISNPTVGNVIAGKLAGPEVQQQFAKRNEAAVTTAVRKDLGVKLSEKIIPELDEVTGKLNPNSPITRALDNASKPYEPIRKMESLVTPKESIDALTELKRQPTIGGEAKTAAINSVVDDALTKLQQTTTGPFSGVGGGPVAVGRSGAAVLDDIRSLRRDAQATYRAQKINPDPLATAKADTQMAIANILEDVIDANASSPKMLGDLKIARTRLAQIYEHERALNYGQQKFDPQVYAKMFEERKGGMSGVGADIAQAAATFPDYFTLTPAQVKGMPRLTRGGIGGAIGGAIGAPLGPFGFVAGTSAGMGVGSLSGSYAARRMASPAYQRANALAPDYRPIPTGLRPVEPNVPVNALAPYDYSQQAFTPPNFVMQPEQYGPRVGTPGFAPGPAQLPAPSAESTMGTLRAEQQRAAGMSRTLGQQAEAQQAAAEAAARRPTKGAVELQINPLTGAPEVAAGIKGATPATFQDFGASLKSATDKATAGRMFDLTAAEKVAFDKTKIDLAEVAPGMKAMTDKAIATKMQDRAWVQDTIAKAQDKARAFEDIAARATTERLRQDALMKREQLLDLLDTLEGQFGKARPVKSSGQGPKTRAFQRNMLRPDDGEIQNALVK